MKMESINPLAYLKQYHSNGLQYVASELVKIRNRPDIDPQIIDSTDFNVIFSFSANFRKIIQNRQTLKTRGILILGGILMNNCTNIRTSWRKKLRAVPAPAWSGTSAPECWGTILDTF